MKLLKIATIIALLSSDIYLYRNTEVDPNCSQVYGAGIVLVLFLQILWGFFVLKPDYLTATLAMTLKPRFPHRSAATIERWAGYLSVIVLIIFFCFSIHMLWEGLRGGTFSGGGLRCVYSN